MTALVVAEHDDHALKAATLIALSAAAQLGGDVHVLVAGSDIDTVALQATGISGVTKVRVAKADHLSSALPEDFAPLIAEIAPAYSHLIAGATSFGKNLMPRVAALLDVAQVSDVVAIQSADTFVSPRYAGNILATVRSADTVKVLTIRTTAFAPAKATDRTAPIESVEAAQPARAVRLAGRQLTRSERPELGDARCVISGGRGMGSAENFRLLEAIADKLGAAIGASRAAVDAGFVPNDYQVGQTGKVVAPELYVAVGISGAIQHLAGMKDSKVIVAINKDQEAPIFEVADYGLVGDLFQVLPELSRALDRPKAD
jgi:electron transfer flavoprotein alpha subunit